MTGEDLFTKLVNGTREQTVKWTGGPDEFTYYHYPWLVTVARKAKVDSFKRPTGEHTFTFITVDDSTKSAMSFTPADAAIQRLWELASGSQPT